MWGVSALMQDRGYLRVVCNLRATGDVVISRLSFPVQTPRNYRTSIDLHRPRTHVGQRRKDPSRCGHTVYTAPRSMVIRPPVQSCEAGAATYLHTSTVWHVTFTCYLRLGCVVCAPSRRGNTILQVAMTSVVPALPPHDLTSTTIV